QTQKQLTLEPTPQVGDDEPHTLLIVPPPPRTHVAVRAQRPSTEFEPQGRTLLERYVVGSVLGKGGFGSVFHATEHDIPRVVKFLHPKLASKDWQVQLFFQEACACSRLKHPNVVGFRDYGRTDDGHLFLVMDQLQGMDLRAQLTGGRSIDWPEALRIALPVLDALHHAHERGVVHRDIKPSNIFMAQTLSGLTVPVLIDFGISSLLDVRDILSARKIVVGSPRYMSPEQVSSQPVTRLSDLYSMGLTLYRSIVGSLPFVDLDPVPMALVRAEEGMPPLQDQCPQLLPRPLCDAIDRAVQTDPADRFQTAQDMKMALLDAAPS
ncbi:MAG: serine/threonine-protein kinase, partial [Myxococcota bacterium]|nr:serine/threonine-protein kinase [Myxococcota bacterium]